MSSPKPIDGQTVIRRIGEAGRIVVTTHARADGDAVGCTAGLCRVLRGVGKHVSAYVHEGVQPRYGFAAHLGPLEVWSPAKASPILDEADLIVVLDTCAAVQLGEIADAIRKARAPKIAIDHHLTRDGIVDEAFVDAEAGACALLVTQICDSAGWPIDADSATLLYMGLATDTGWFRFSNADRTVYQAAARLIGAGARPNELYELLYLSDVLPRVRLAGAVLSSFELHAGGRLAVIRLTRDVFARCGATPDMTDELINEPQRLGSAVACVMFVEPPDEGPVRVSFRSKRDLDVAALATRFGGGGHARAAAAKIPGKIDEVAKRVIGELARELEALGGAS